MSRWFVESVTISGGFLDGLEVAPPARPSLTCIIGPRGSGKTTLAEAIRYGIAGLGDASRTRANLIQGTLGHATVRLSTCGEAEGQAYVITRRYDQPPNLTAASGEPITDVDLDRGTFLPLDGYTDREIEAIAEERGASGERRRQLLDELHREEHRKLLVALSGLRRALDANAEAIHRTTSRLDDLREQSEELHDAPARLDALPEVAESPLGSEHDELNARGLAEEHELAELDRAEQFLSECEQTMARLHAVEEEAPRIASDQSLADVQGVVDAVAGRIVDAARTIQIELDTRRAELATIRSSLERAHDATTARLGEIEQTSAAIAEALAERGRVRREVERLERLQSDYETETKRLDDLLEERKRLRFDYLRERERISELRETATEALQAKAGERVRVRVFRHADTSAYAQRLRTALPGAHVRNHEDIVDRLLRLRPEDLGQILRDGDVAELAHQTDLGETRSRKLMKAFRERLDPLALEVIPIDDRIGIELNVGTDREPRFKDAALLSQGQKCTALLPLLLARRDVPLVIDQPEDNLDNHFIYETVVRAVAQVKQTRQLVFVTHNANIPVLGDADLVVVLDSDGQRGFVHKRGTVDDCRDEIVDLLEGGREAFERRRELYAR